MEDKWKRKGCTWCSKGQERRKERGKVGEKKREGERTEGTKEREVIFYCLTNRSE